MRTGLRLLTPPTGEPVSLAEAKEHCRIDADDTSQDKRLLSYLRFARDYVERFSGLQLVSAKYRLTLDGFPSCIWPEPRPLQAVTAIQYYDTANSQQTLATTVYAVDVTRSQGSIQLAWGQSWPSTYSRPDAVTVDFWAGHGPVTATQAGFEAGDRTVTPSSMVGIYAGTELLIGEGELQERIVVTSVTSTTFTATFAHGHPDPCDVRPALPEQATQAIMLLACRWFEDRGDASSADTVRAEEASLRLLRKAWPEGVCP